MQHKSSLLRYGSKSCRFCTLEVSYLVCFTTASFLNQSCRMWHNPWNVQYGRPSTVVPQAVFWVGQRQCVADLTLPYH